MPETVLGVRDGKFRKQLPQTETFMGHRLYDCMQACVMGKFYVGAYVNSTEDMRITERVG